MQLIQVKIRFMTCELINKVPGTLTANRPLRTYADKEMGLTWLKARIYCFGEVILVQDLDYLSVSIYFMNDPICGESNYYFSLSWKHEKTCSIFWGHGKGTMAFNAF